MAPRDRKAPAPNAPIPLEKQDRIVELKLARIPTRTIAEQVGVAPNTVTKYWHDYLGSIDGDRKAAHDRKQAEMIARLDSVAAEARRDLVRVEASKTMTDDEKHRARARHRSEERQALRQLAQIAGWEAPIRVQAQVGVETMSEEKAREIMERYERQSKP